MGEPWWLDVCLPDKLGAKWYRKILLLQSMLSRFPIPERKRREMNKYQKAKRKSGGLRFPATNLHCRTVSSADSVSPLDSLRVCRAGSQAHWHPKNSRLSTSMQLVAACIPTLLALALLPRIKGISCCHYLEICHISLLSLVPLTGVLNLSLCFPCKREKTSLCWEVSRFPLFQLR